MKKLVTIIGILLLTAVVCLPCLCSTALAGEDGIICGATAVVLDLAGRIIEGLEAWQKSNSPSWVGSIRNSSTKLEA